MEALREPDDLTGRLRETLPLTPGTTATAAVLMTSRRLRESVDRAVLAVADSRVPPARDAAQPVGSGGPQTRAATRHHRRSPGTRRPHAPRRRPRTRPGAHLPGRRRPASVRRDRARTRLWSRSLRPAFPGPLPGPQPPMVLHVPLRKPHQGPPPSGAFTTERPYDSTLTEKFSVHSGDLTRKAGPGTLSMSFACTGWPCSQRIWTSTRAPHSRCRVRTAGPSGSAR